MSQQEIYTMAQQEAARRRWADPEYRKRQAEAWERRKQRQPPKEPKVPRDKSLSASERNKKLWQDPAYRAKQTEARRRNWDNPDYRERSSRSGKNRGENNPAFKHGEATRVDRSVEYTAFTAARSRCTNRNNRKWKDYGGRGIKFLFVSFEQFLAAVGRRPSTEYSLDRFPNNNGNYEPGNVRWATQSEQVANRRPTEEWQSNCRSCGHPMICPHCSSQSAIDDAVYADA
jgi:hypothetical protein